jgi:hypothetical protein
MRDPVYVPKPAIICLCFMFNHSLDQINAWRCTCSRVCQGVQRKVCRVVSIIFVKYFLRGDLPALPRARSRATDRTGRLRRPPEAPFSSAVHSGPWVLCTRVASATWFLRTQFFSGDIPSIAHSNVPLFHKN